jgi:outer membrane protein TolC
VADNLRKNIPALPKVVGWKAAIIAACISCLPAVAEKPRAVASLSGEVPLERIVAFALKNNPKIREALLEIERTRGQYIEVRAEALPSVTGTGTYTQEDKDLLERVGNTNANSFSGSNSGNSRGGDKSWRFAVEARQLLYSGGQVRSAINIARNTTDAGHLALLDTVEQVIALTRQQFYAVILNRELIRVAEESITLLEEELKDQKNRFDAGTVPKFNVLRAEVELANARPELIRAKNNYLLAILDLAKTIGFQQPKNAQPPFTASGELRVVEHGWTIERALTLAKNRRASLKVQERNVRNETEQVEIARSNGKPRLEASAGYELRNSRITDDLSKEANGWYFGLQGSWNIFDGGATQGKVIQAQAKLGTARVRQQDAIQQVELEVQRAFARLREARELIASQMKTVEQADEALRLAKERLAAGAGTQLDVLDARVALTRARTTELQAKYDYNSALAEFDRATGADTVFDDTFKDATREKAKMKLRGGKAELRPAD